MAHVKRTALLLERRLGWRPSTSHWGWALSEHLRLRLLIQATGVHRASRVRGGAVESHSVLVLGNEAHSVAVGRHAHAPQHKRHVRDI